MLEITSIQSYFYSTHLLMAFMTSSAVDLGVNSEMLLECKVYFGLLPLGAGLLPFLPPFFFFCCFFSRSSFFRSGLDNFFFAVAKSAIDEEEGEGDVTDADLIATNDDGEKEETPYSPRLDFKHSSTPARHIFRFKIIFNVVKMYS